MPDREGFHSILRAFFRRLSRREAGLFAQPIVLLISGGRDSMVLLEVMASFRSGEGGRFLAPRVLHFNHGVRGAASDGDEELVGRRAAELGMEFACERFSGLDGVANFEAEARRRRLEAIFRRPERYFLLAHHRDDQVENFFIRLFQNDPHHTQFSIRSRSRLGGKILLRPLLDLRRNELVAFAIRENIQFREDATNREPLCLRNRIRNEIIPALNGVCPTVVERLARLQKRLDRETRKPAGRVRSEDSSIRAASGREVECARTLIYSYFPGFRARSGFWRELAAGLRGDRGVWQLAGDLRLTLYRGRLFLYSPSRISPPATERQGNTLFHGPFAVELGDLEVVPMTSSPGDEVTGLPSGSTRKKIFQSAGIPPHLRSFYPLILRGGRLVAVGDLKTRAGREVFVKVERRFPFPCVNRQALL